MGKASSPVYRRLRHLFLQKSTPTATATAVVTPAGDNNTKKLVKKYKSNSSSFGGQLFIHKTTFLRLAKSGHFSSVRDVLDHNKLYPEAQNEAFTARLIYLYGEAKMLDHALQLFDEMPQLNCPRTVLSFNALLSACLTSASFDKAVELFQELPAKLSIKPNLISYTTAITASCKTGSLDTSISMLKEMDKNNVEPNTVTFNILLNAFYRSGRFSEAENLWNLMEEKKVIPDLGCYNSRLLGMVNENRFSEAMVVFEGFEKKGLKPNIYTYNYLMKGFVDKGDMEEVKKWYGKILESGNCRPDFITFRTLIPFACDNGDIDFARELYEKSVGLKINFPSCKIMQEVIDKVVGQFKVGDARVD
ncbi:hypothetical protein ABFS82_09G069800 [Erythranthe guttata]|nr:PREDICTED: pentatricopeptide repeat-containing protein At3g13160, mitochondrial-like [Erythranthe guttata]|eukprot:XP_012854676.1 PREDICTED: pentatricopeptide repeat-containing protein At3g13160, mitochondrial-like [Erythranthe guttata]